MARFDPSQQVSQLLVVTAVDGLLHVSSVTDRGCALPGGIIHSSAT